MTLKDSWSHFIFHICKCFLEFATRGKHDVRALDVLLGEQSLRSGSFAFQGDTECSEAVQGDSVALGKMLGQRSEEHTSELQSRCSDRRLKTSSSTASIMPCEKKRRCSVTFFTSFLCETFSLATHFAYAFLGIVLSDAFLIEKTWYFIIMTDCFHSWKPRSFLWRHSSRLCLYWPFRPSGWRLGLCGLLRD